MPVDLPKRFQYILYRLVSYDALSLSSIRSIMINSERRYPMPWQGAKSEDTHDNANFCHVVCRSHELIQEPVWTITFFRHFLSFLFGVVISHVCSTDVKKLVWHCGAKRFTPSLPEHGILVTSPLMIDAPEMMMKYS